MTATFPFTLPRPQRNGYSYEVHRPVAVTAMDRGCGRVRRIGFGQTTKSTLRWLFTDFDLATFVAFWRYDLGCGSQEFTLPLITSYADRLVTVMPTAPFTQVANAGRWTVELPVEWIDRPLADAPTLKLMLATSGAYPNAPTDISNFHTLVQFTLPVLFTDVGFDPNLATNAATFHALIHVTLARNIP